MGIKLLFICIGFALTFWTAVVKGVEKEKCLLYSIDGNTSNSNLEMKNMVLTLYYPYDFRGSLVKIMAKEECILGIYNRMKRNEQESMKCDRDIFLDTSRYNIWIKDEGNKWQADMFGIEMKNTNTQNFRREIDTISLKGNAQDSISYYLDCNDECYDFEKGTVMYDKYYEISLFGCKIDPKKEINTTLKFVHENSYIKKKPTYLGGYWNSFTPKEQCFHVHLHFERLEGTNYHDLHAFISPGYEPHLLAEKVTITHRHVSFDFSETSNIRWSMCLPKQFPGSVSRAQANVTLHDETKREKCMLCVYITLPALVLLILTNAATAILLCKISRVARSRAGRKGTANPDQVQAVRPIQEQNRDRSNNDPDKFVTHPRDDDYDNPHGVIRPNSEHHYEEIPIVIYDDVMNRENRDRRREHH